MQKGNCVGKVYIFAVFFLGFLSLSCADFAYSKEKNTDEFPAFLEKNLGCFEESQECNFRDILNILDYKKIYQIVESKVNYSSCSGVGEVRYWTSYRMLMSFALEKDESKEYSSGEICYYAIYTLDNKKIIENLFLENVKNLSIRVEKDDVEDVCLFGFYHKLDEWYVSLRLSENRRYIFRECMSLLFILSMLRSEDIEKGDFNISNYSVNEMVNFFYKSLKSRSIFLKRFRK